MLGDKAYSAATYRKLPRRTHIRAVIPECCDQIANRKRRGRPGGPTPGFDKEKYKNLNVVERAFNKASVAGRRDPLQ